MTEMNDRPSQEAHWADRVAGDVSRSGRDPVISTGISPSGEIHIGNMREVLTGDAVYRALIDRGESVRFNFVADNLDPLRKVYPFLDSTRYGPLVGCPLSEIPCPCGDHASYSDHFLQPFLRALAELHINVEVEPADQLYKSGRMNPYVLEALAQRDRIVGILADITGKQQAADWSPFNPLCPECGKINQARVTGFSTSDETVSYECACSATGAVPIAGGGKLNWRIDWPARWMALGVTVEPFGKDHATSGGSYETGARLIRDIYGAEPPLPIPYEWIRLAGKGDMSSSKGNVLSIGDILEVAPPEALRYLVLRERPQKTIKFDPGLPLLRLVDELDDDSAAERDPRAVELSQAAGFSPVGLSYKHLVVVAQVAGFDPDKTMAILEREGRRGISREGLVRRLNYARKWLASFAPEDLKFTVQPLLPEAVTELDDTQRTLLGQLSTRLQEGMDGEVVHNLIFELARDAGESNARTLFQAIYIALLGKPRGPRAGWFIALLDIDFCRRRFEEAAGGQS